MTHWEPVYGFPVDTRPAPLIHRIPGQRETHVPRLHPIILGIHHRFQHQGMLARGHVTERRDVEGAIAVVVCAEANGSAEDNLWNGPSCSSAAECK